MTIDHSTDTAGPVWLPDAVQMTNSRMAEFARLAAQRSGKRIEIAPITTA